jgi:hypothetical protein
MLAKVCSAAVNGIERYPVEVEVMMAWDHWWSGDLKMDTATLKEYIQLAADMGWPYQLVDWQWYGEFNQPASDITKVNPAVDLNEVRRFAREKGVRLWLWLYWTDADHLVWRHVDQPCQRGF